MQPWDKIAAVRSSTKLAGPAWTEEERALWSGLPRRGSS
jgi:hypothetical protein